MVLWAAQTLHELGPASIDARPHGVPDRCHRAASSKAIAAPSPDAALVLLNHGDVGVLQGGPPDLEVADVIVLSEQFPDKGGGIRRGVDELLAVAAPPDLCLAGHPPASSSALPSATIRPPARIKIRSASLSASSRSWVVRRMVVSSRSDSR